MDKKKGTEIPVMYWCKNNQLILKNGTYAHGIKTVFSTNDAGTAGCQKDDSRDTSYNTYYK